MIFKKVRSEVRVQVSMRLMRLRARAACAIYSSEVPRLRIKVVSTKNGV